jgi:integrase
MRQIIAASDEPYRTIYWLFSETGVRSGELCGLSIDDIDFNRGMLFVRRSVWQGKLQMPKTKKAFRHCLLSSDLLEHLQQFLNSWKANEHRLLFASRNGTPVDSDNIRKRHLYPLLDNLGIRRAGLHAFRHGNSSVMDSLGTPLKLRQDRLGHADASFTIQTFASTTAFTRFA